MKKPDGQQMSASRAPAGWYVGDCKTKWTIIQSQAECSQQMQEGGWPIYTKKGLLMFDSVMLFSCWKKLLA